MRMIRSLFFGGLAMLAAAIFISVPASAFDRAPGIYSTPADVLAYYALPDAVPHDAIMAERQIVTDALAIEDDANTANLGYRYG